MPYQFNSTYLVNTLIPALNSAVFRSELQGNASLVTSFSYAGGNSTYSFGLYQYDVGNNPGARQLLAQIGFSPEQIGQLSQHGGLSAAQQSALSAQLQTALQNPTNAASLQAFNNAWAQGLVGQLTDVLNTVAASGPNGRAIAEQVFQNTALQVQIIDYGNQFHLDLNGRMTNWLMGNAVNMAGGRFQIAPGTTLSRDMIRQFVMGTDYGVHHAGAEANRENALFGLLNYLPTGEPSKTQDDTPQGNVPIPTFIINGRSGDVIYLDPTQQKFNSDQEKMIKDAVDQAIKGQSSANGVEDGTVACSTSADGGMLPSAGGDGAGGESGDGSDGGGYGGGDGGGGYGGGDDGGGDDPGGDDGGGRDGDGDGDGHGGKLIRDNNPESIKTRSASSVLRTAHNTDVAKDLVTSAGTNRPMALATPITPTFATQHSANQLIQSMANFDVLASATSQDHAAKLNLQPAHFGFGDAHPLNRRAA